MADSTKKYLTYEGLSYYDGKVKSYADGKATAAKNAAVAASVVAVDTKETANTGYAKTYVVKQNNVSVGEIDIPKDLVIASGRVVTNPEGQPAGTYVELTLNDAGSDKIYINVATLVDVYTAQQNATQVQVAVDSATNVISATIVAGSIGTTELANGAVTADKLGAKSVTTAKIDDGAVGTTQLASGVVTSLGKADSAVQSVVEGATDGTVSVDGTDVAVHGLGTAAYTAASAYETAGAAQALANGQVATNTSNISGLDSRVTALEGATLGEISNAEIDALFTTPAQS